MCYLSFIFQFSLIDLRGKSFVSHSRPWRKYGKLLWDYLFNFIGFVWTHSRNVFSRKDRCNNDITCSGNHVENLFISASGLLKSSSIWRRSLAAFLSLLMHAQPRRCSCCKASLLHHKIKDSYWTDHVLVHINSPRVFSFLISTSNSVVFIAARISYIRFFTAVHMYDFHGYNHYSSLGRFI